MFVRDGPTVLHALFVLKRRMLNHFRYSLRGQGANAFVLRTHLAVKNMRHLRRSVQVVQMMDIYDRFTDIVASETTAGATQSLAVK